MSRASRTSGVVRDYPALFPAPFMPNSDVTASDPAGPSNCCCCICAIRFLRCSSVSPCTCWPSMPPRPRSAEAPQLVGLFVAMLVLHFGVGRIAIGFRHMLGAEFVKRLLQFGMCFLGADHVGDLQHRAGDGDGEGFVGDFRGFHWKISGSGRDRKSVV